MVSLMFLQKKLFKAITEGKNVKNNLIRALYKGEISYFHYFYNWPIAVKESPLNSVLLGLHAIGIMHCGPYLEFLATSTEFSESNFKVSLLPPSLVEVDISYPHYSGCLLS